MVLKRSVGAFPDIMDPGAAESTAPPSTDSHFPVMEPPGSQAEQEYPTAGYRRLRKTKVNVKYRLGLRKGVP